MPKPRKFLSVYRAAAASGIGAQTIRRAVTAGRLKRAADEHGTPIEFLVQGRNVPLFIDERDLIAFKRTYVDGRLTPVGQN